MRGGPPGGGESGGNRRARHSTGIDARGGQSSAKSTRERMSRDGVHGDRLRRREPGALRVRDETQRRLFVLGDDARARRRQRGERRRRRRHPRQRRRLSRIERGTSPSLRPRRQRRRQHLQPVGTRTRARRAERRVQHGARREGGTPSGGTPRRRSRARALRGDANNVHASACGSRYPRVRASEMPRRIPRRTFARREGGQERERSTKARVGGGVGESRPSFELRDDVRGGGVRGGASRSNRLPHRLVVLLSRCRPPHVASHARASCPGVTRAG